MRQEWHDLLYAHWRVEPAVLRRLVPQQLELDVWNGDAYLAVTPLVVRRLRPRGAPALPVISNFSEVNVRTYVTLGGVPGVFFFSLDAHNLSATLGARFLYGLPYYKAEMKIRNERGWIHYQSRRRQRPQPAELRVSYRTTSEVMPWRPPRESLERFLTERYCLYAVIGSHVYRAHVHHIPVPLQTAAADIQANSMTEPLSIGLAPAPDWLHFSKFLDVLVWLPERVT